jgi:hypothetical protein
MHPDLACQPFNRLYDAIAYMARVVEQNEPQTQTAAQELFGRVIDDLEQRFGVDIRSIVSFVEIDSSHDLYFMELIFNQHCV